MRICLSGLLIGLVLLSSFPLGKTLALAETLCQGTGTCANPGGDPLADPNNKLVTILYEFLDYKNVNWRVTHPDWGAVGSWYYEGWKVVQGSAQDGSFSPFAQYLKKICSDSTCTVNYRGKQIHKPVALSVILTNQGSDDTPEWVYASGAQKFFIPSKTEGCSEIQIPSWGDEKWQEAYAQMVMKFGQAFKDNPVVDSIWIATGNYGETATTVKIHGCVYDLGHNGLFGNWLVRGWNDNGRRRSIAELYREAFGEKPVFMLITGGTAAGELASIACSVDVGFKTNTLHPYTPMGYGCNGRAASLVQIADRLKGRCAIGYENAFLSRSYDTYWALMFSLAHGADLIDLESDEKSGGTQFFGVINSLQMPAGEPLWDFWQRHAGHGFRPGEEAPEEVWIMLREAEPGRSCKENKDAWNAQESGDWEFYLYRPENTCQGVPIGVCEEGTDMGNRYNQDVPGGTTEYVPPAAVGGGEGVYGAWGARKTANNGSMFFRLDERWSLRTKTAFDIFVTYWADGGTFGFKYYDSSGNLQEKVVTKNGTGWQTATISITNADLTKTLIPGGNNFALTSGGDGDDIFHLVIVSPKGSSPPPTWTCPKYAASWNSFSPVVCTSFPSLSASSFTAGDCSAITQSASGGWWTTYVANYSQAGGATDFAVEGNGIYTFSCRRKPAG